MLTSEEYDSAKYEDLTGLFAIFPNLIKLIVPRYDMDNVSSYLLEKGGDKILLQLAKHLKTLSVFTDYNYQGSSELYEAEQDFKKTFYERVPGLTVDGLTTDDDDEDEDDSEGDESEGNEGED